LKAVLYGADVLGIAWLLGEDFVFPPTEQANADGLLALGGLVTPTTLRRAYRSGIFPWPVDPRFPVLWFCPPQRFVLELDALKVSRSLRKSIRNRGYEVRWDTRFSEVLQACAEPRGDDGGTWIDHRIIPGFEQLHSGPRVDGVSAHSIEVWREDKLVGGLYGIAAGGVVSGESMFFREPDASKVALVALVDRMRERGFSLLDCQVHTPHLERLGAVEIPRDRFLERLAAAVDDDCQL
jgi:leucyl/phenylalanyl-tRNA--protein transferase